MDQKINNSLEQHTLEILRQIGNMSNYSEVETVIAGVIDPGKDNSFQGNILLKALEAKIESLSPLLFTSTQWSCLRYALICLRNISK